MGVVKFIELPEQRVLLPFGEAIAEGLKAKPPTLPSRFFYDEIGSRLFEQIMELPEYYLTRCEHEILLNRADAILNRAGRDLSLIEFGSGNSAKTRLLLEAALSGPGAVHYVPIDISAACLRASTDVLADSYPELAITAFAAEYNDAIPLLPQTESGRLFLFMGSNVGNFEAWEARAFLGKIAAHMGPKDRLLVGYDLVKDRDIIQAAYDDSFGVTAAFNKNLLARINRELGADFDLEAFTHAAPFIEEPSRIEMRLVATEAQTVNLTHLDSTFYIGAGGFIHTENSHKYTELGFANLANSAGLSLQETWTDAKGWFALSLLERSV